MFEIPKIIGADVLREIVRLTKDLPQGSPFTINLADSHDLLKLTAKELAEKVENGGFGFEEHLAEDVAVELRKNASLESLSKAIGIQLIIDKGNRRSVIPNAGIIRSAGAAADDEETLEEMLAILDRIRHG
jgi:hypothetical protein